jgi:RNA polymerase sigma-70 factor, ECF subfamily
MWDLHTLFKKHAHEIVQSLRRRGIREDVADDITQEAFVRVLSSPPKETSAKVNQAGYLYMIARNLGVDHLRRARLISFVSLEPEDFARIRDVSPSPEQITYDRQLLDLTQRALRELPERTRRAFEMHRIEEMTIAAIAAELNLSISRVWKLIQDAYEHVDGRLPAQ